MFFKRKVVLAQEYLAFTLLNLFDLFLSGLIFKHGGVEANGLAAMILYGKAGALGFAVFKFALVVIVILACEGIAVRNVRKARIVITLGCFVYALLIIYESTMIFHIPIPMSTHGPTNA